MIVLVRILTILQTQTSQRVAAHYQITPQMEVILLRQITTRLPIILRPTTAATQTLMISMGTPIFSSRLRG